MRITRFLNQNPHPALVGHLIDALEVPINHPAHALLGGLNGAVDRLDAVLRQVLPRQISAYPLLCEILAQQRIRNMPQNRLGRVLTGHAVLRCTPAKQARGFPPV